MLKMPYSNRNELSRLFGTFCHLWSKGLHAKVQMEKRKVVVFWLSLRSNWTNPTSLSLQAFPVSGEAIPNVLHGNIRTKNQALPMHQVNQVHLEPPDVVHVDAAQKRSSVLDCVLQHIRLL